MAQAMTERGRATSRRFNIRASFRSGSVAGSADEVAPVVEELVEERARVVEHPGELAVLEANQPGDQHRERQQAEQRPGGHLGEVDGPDDLSRGGHRYSDGSGFHGYLHPRG